MDAMFQGLTKGLKFNAKTNGLALEAFGKRKRPVEDHDDQDDDTEQVKNRLKHGHNADDDEDDELDFFGSKEKTGKKVEIATATKSKKNNNSKRAVKDQNSDSEDEDGEQSELEEEDAKVLRKRLKIKVKGNAVPLPIVTFSEKDLLLSSSSTDKMDKKKKYMASILRKNIENSKYVEPTAIQMQSIPSMLMGRDCLGCAPTGSGKTAAFLIPLIMNLASSSQEKKGGIRSLIIVPTRELAAQILREFEKLTAGKHLRACLLRKSSSGTVAADQKGYDMIATAPLRLVQMIREKTIDLRNVETLILDEADKLFEMGFLEQIDEIIAACSNERIQRALFSATIPPGIEQLAQSILRDAVEITVGTKNAGAETIDQKLMFVGQERGKLLAIRQLLREGELVPPTLVFVQSKERAQQLYQELAYDGIKVDAIHSDRTQAQRDTVVKKFRRSDIWVLICTDLMGRGIDFKGVNCVVNYDFPTTAVSYIHRIGRTGRANRSGKAITLFTLDDVENLRSIANVIKLSGCPVEEWMLKLKKNRGGGRHNKHKKKAPVERRSISTVTRYDRKKRAKKGRSLQQQQQQQQE